MIQRKKQRKNIFITDDGKGDEKNETETKRDCKGLDLVAKMTTTFRFHEQAVLFTEKERTSVVVIQV